MQLISVKCPDCGMALEIEETRKQAFCSYCGARVLLHNENEFTYRHVDEAALKQAETEQAVQLKKAETERDVQLKQIEIEEQTRITILQKSTMMHKLALILGGIGVLFTVIGFAAGSDSKLGILLIIGILLIVAAVYIWKHDAADSSRGALTGEKKTKIRVPASAFDFSRKNYAAVEAAFKSAGFTNVVAVPLKNLTIGVFKKPGFVESITINGKTVVPGRKKYSSDAAVVISYHSIAERK